MKKFISALSTALLVVILALTLSACDKSGAIENNFKDNGYNVKIVNADNSLAKAVFDLCGLSNDQIEEINSYEILYCSKNLSAAVVVKFPSSGKLKDFLTVEKDGKKDDSAYTAKKDKGDINGNCLLYTMNEGARDIFKKA